VPAVGDIFENIVEYAVLRNAGSPGAFESKLTNALSDGANKVNSPELLLLRDPAYWFLQCCEKDIKTVVGFTKESIVVPVAMVVKQIVLTRCERESAMRIQGRKLHVRFYVEIS